MENKKEYKKNPLDIGAFWRNLSKKGLEYFSGSLMLGGQEYKMTLFKCKAYKEGGKIPYFNVLLQDPDYKKNNDSRPAPQKEVEQEINTEEIPF